MGSAAMDALKYGSYMSGLYGSMAASSTTSTDPTNTTSNNGSKSPYLQQHGQDMSPKPYDASKAYNESNNAAAAASAAASSLKGNYTADSLSRSYFDASRYETAGGPKSYTPDSMAGGSGGRASAESPDAMKQMQMQQQQPQDSSMQPQQHSMGFNSLQAYYSQHGMAAAASSNMAAGPSVASGSASGTLPPFLPMAAQLSQYSAAASAAASAAVAAGSNYSQSSPSAAAAAAASGAAGSEYRRPLSVLF